MILSGTRKIHLIDTVRGTIVNSYVQPKNVFIYALENFNHDTIAFVTEKLDLEIVKLPDFKNFRSVATEHKNVCFSLKRINNRLCVTGAYDKSLRVFDYVSEKKLSEIQTESDVNSIDIVSDREVLVGSDGRITIYNIATGKKAKEWELVTSSDSIQHDQINYVYDVAVIKNTDFFIAAVYRTLRIYSVNKKQFIREFLAHSDVISFLKLLDKSSIDMLERKLKFEANSICLLSSSDDQSIKLWTLDPKTFRHRNLKSFHHGCKIMWLIVLVETRPHVFCSCGENRKIKIWNMISGNLLRSIHHRDDVCAMIELGQGSVVSTGVIGHRLKNFEIMKEFCVKDFLYVQIHENQNHELIRLPEWFLYIHSTNDFSECFEKKKFAKGYNSLEREVLNIQISSVKEIDQDLLLRIIYGIENKEMINFMNQEKTEMREQVLNRKFLDLYSFFEFLGMINHSYVLCQFFGEFSTKYLLYSLHFAIQNFESNLESSSDKFNCPLTLAVFNALKRRETEITSSENFRKFLERINLLVSFQNHRIEPIQNHSKFQQNEIGSDQNYEFLANSFQEIFEFNLEKLYSTIRKESTVYKSSDDDVYGSNVDVFLNQFSRKMKIRKFSIISSDRETFYVHKDVLCFLSGFFRYSLKHGNVEKLRNSETVMMNTSSSILRNVISFIYCGQFPNQENLKFRDMYDLILNKELFSVGTSDVYNYEEMELKEYTLSQIDILMKKHADEFHLKLLETGYLISQMDENTRDEMLKLWEGHFEVSVKHQKQLIQFSTNNHAKIEDLKTKNLDLEIKIKEVRKRKRGEYEPISNSPNLPEDVNFPSEKFRDEEEEDDEDDYISEFMDENDRDRSSKKRRIM